jgi:arginyl-tRNA synthetase
MNPIKEKWQHLMQEALNELLKKQNTEPLTPEAIIFETPPRPELGDMAFPMFPYARHLKKAPPEIAKSVVAALETFTTAHSQALPGKVTIVGGYLNVFFDKPAIIGSILEEALQPQSRSVYTEKLKGKRIMCEFSCPNTNKPLHLGHLRNDSLGESITRILKANGAEVFKVNLINDRGVHICKSMLAYKKFGEGKGPAEEQLKSDHFVGKYYVLFDKWSKTDPGGKEAAEAQAQEMLRLWEKGDQEVKDLWEKMNHWAISGIEETYKRTGISFDKTYYESETYLLGREEILKGLEKGLFYRKDDGSVWVDLSSVDLDQKVLLRGDGTSLYVTQDIGTALRRSHDWPFEQLIYVVASEQRYHFQVLFKVLELLGAAWARNLYHLAYGMVNLPEGKMKSREGTVVDADTLLDELKALAKEEIMDKGRDSEVEDIEGTAEKIAIGALNYFLLQTTPTKDMLFNPKESISFNGHTGPYLQYTGARIASILRKADEREETLKKGKFLPELLTVSEEWELVKQIEGFPEVVAQAGMELNPALLANYLYDVAKNFNKYYHDNPILHNENIDLIVSRLRMAKAIRSILTAGLDLLAIPFLERM